MKLHFFLAALLGANAAAATSAADLFTDVPEARRKPALVLTDVATKFYQVLISPDGKLVAASGSDGQVRIWSLETGKLLRRLDERPRWIGSGCNMAFTRDGKALLVNSQKSKPDLSAYEDERTTWWDPATGKQLRVMKGDESFGGLVQSPDGKSMATTGGGNLLLRDPHTAKVRTTLEMPKDWKCMAFMPDGKSALTCNTSDEITLWDLATAKGRIWHKQSRGLSLVNEMLVAPDGKAVAVVHRGGVALLDLRTAKPKWAGDGPFNWTPRPNLAGCMAFTRDGRWLLVGATKAVAVLDASTGQLLFHNRTDNIANIHSLSVSPDGRWLATTAASEKRVHVWKLSDW